MEPPLAGGSIDYTLKWHYYATSE